MWFRHRKEDRDDPIATKTVGLAEEVEAFLAGAYLQRAQHLGDPIPGWAWLNSVAHGELATIAEVCRSTASSPPRRIECPIDAWKAAQEILARELVALVRQDRDACGVCNASCLFRWNCG